MKQVPVYTTPDGFRCPQCDQECRIVAWRSDFDTPFGTHYPQGWGSPITDCCEIDVDIEPDEPPEADRDDG